MKKSELRQIIKEEIIRLLEKQSIREYLPVPLSKRKKGEVWTTKSGRFGAMSRKTGEVEYFKYKKEAEAFAADKPAVKMK